MRGLTGGLWIAVKLNQALVLEARMKGGAHQALLLVHRGLGPGTFGYSSAIGQWRPVVERANALRLIRMQRQRRMPPLQTGRRGCISDLSRGNLDNQ
jgi:hypothetical protein